MNELSASNLADRNRMSPRGDLSDLEAAKESFAALHQASPDIKWQVDDVIAEGDMVVARRTAKGIHKSPFMGIPTEGEKVEFSGIEIVRLSDGKAVEHREQFDLFTFMQQLGAIPKPN
jgi:steroid delta-isomerase-like uncharacterized protein